MSESPAVESLVQKSFEEAWELFKKDVVLYVLAGLITLVLGCLTLGVLFGPLLVGFIQVVRHRQAGEVVTVSDVFGGLQSFLPAFLATLILGVLVVLGSMLLVLPGLVVGFLGLFTFHFIAFKNVPVGTALAGSLGLVKDHFAGALVLFILLAILNGIGSAIPFAVLVAFPFGLLVLTMAFEKLTAGVP